MSASTIAHKRPHPAIAILLSDVGGILVRDQWARAATLLAPRRAGSVTTLLEALRREAGQVDLGAATIHDMFDRVRSRLEPTVRLAAFEKVVLDDSIEVIQENVEFYRKIARSSELRLAALTNVGPEIAQALDRKLRLSDLFDPIVRSFEVGVAKPDPRIFRRALTACRTPAEQVLFVDDSPTYVGAASRLGIQSLLIPEPTALIGEIRSRLGELSGAG
jgi:FMN phosphatase YigB (HAD superfamily)